MQVGERGRRELKLCRRAAAMKVKELGRLVEYDAKILNSGSDLHVWSGEDGRGEALYAK